MKVRWICAALCGLILSGATGVAQAQIAATVLKDVVVDGNLDEWPDDLEKYPIRNHSGVYGPTDIDDVDLSTNDDLSPSFRVGYDPDENLLYVGVEVWDDDLVVGNDSRNTDACEVYVYGGDRDDKRKLSNPLQYVMVPGGGSYGGQGNPSLIWGEIGRTRTQGAYSRKGDFTVYEWAIEVFEKFPKSTVDLRSGIVIGFDVIAVDKDDDWENAAWVSWGPSVADKSSSSGRIGRLQLLDETGNWSAVAPPDMEQFDRDMDKFGEDMGEFGEDMGRFGQEIARLATGAAALGLEEAARELEREGLREGVDLREARHALETARHQLEAERHQLEEIRHNSWGGEKSEVIENIVGIVGAAFIILTIGLTIGLVAFIARRGQKHPVQAEILDELAERLETVEQRLTDTQDVMIALNEKFDRMEGGSRDSH
jgi:hypothetical protein